MYQNKPMNIFGLYKGYSKSRYQRYGSLFVLFLIAVFTLLILTPDIAGQVILMSLLFFAALFDLRYRLIPNPLILFGIMVWIGLAPYHSIGWTESIGAAVAACGLLMAVRHTGHFLYSKSGLGMGDIKLFLVVGLFLGWDAFWVLYLTILLGGMFCTVGMVSGMMNRGQTVPLGPFVAGAGIIGLVFLPWNQVLEWLL